MKQKLSKLARTYGQILFFPYPVIYQKTCQILGFLNIYSKEKEKNIHFGCYLYQKYTVPQKKRYIVDM